jgi:hypothetical protein
MTVVGASAAVLANIAHGFKIFERSPKFCMGDKQV